MIHNYAKLAARDFQRGFYGRTPFDLVHSGERSLDDWLRALDCRREQSERAFALEGRRTKTARVSNRTRLLILSCLERCPATIIKLREFTGLTGSTLDPALTRLSTLGLVEARADFTLEPRGCWSTDAGTFSWHLLPRGARELTFLRGQSLELRWESPALYEAIKFDSGSRA
jgi:DNA-binding transcriptional ArsR family regulator